MSLTSTSFRLYLSALLLGLLSQPLAVQAQLVITQASTPTVETFDGLGTATSITTAATLPAGFKLSASATPTYAATTNTTATTASTTHANNFTTGASYNFGSGGTTAGTDTDRALGFLSSGSFALPRSILVAIRNTTGATITDLKVQFDLEQYRTNTQSPDWKFFSSTDGSTWTSQAAGDQNFPAVTTANALYYFPPNVTTKSLTLTGLNVANGATCYLRWTMQASVSTSSQGIGLDNLVLTPTLAGTPVAAAITTTPATYASPYCVTTTAGSASFAVGYTTQGTLPSATFQAQLSNAAGVFPADLTANILGSGTSSPLTVMVPAGTPSGTGYRIRVLNGTVVGSDNSNDLVVTLAPTTNPVTVTPGAPQSFASNASGTLLTATPTVASTVAWLYGTSAAGPFTTAITGATTTTYQPQGSDFSAGPGTYYVVAQATSTCGSVVGTTSPVTITVTASAAAFTLSTSTLPSFGTVPVGSTSAAKSFTVSGTTLAGSVTVTPPPGFEIRTGSTPFACCALTLTPDANGTLSATTIDVRFAPLAAQAYADHLALTSPGLAEQDVTVAGTGTTPSYPATVATTMPSAITTTAATAGGTVLADGGSAVTAYGVAWSTSPEPTAAASHTTDGSGTGSFTSALTGLQPGTQYYVRAYATNGQGTTYGEQYTLTTVAVPLASEPTASSTVTASKITYSRLLLTFTGGTGAKHLVLAHLNGSVSQDPTDATTYTANPTFGKGSALGVDLDNYVVFAAVGDTVTVFGLHPNNPYSFTVYDYNDNGTPYAENYRTSDPGTLALTLPALPPTLLLQEDFAYASGTLLTATTWVAHSGAGTKPVTVTSGNLTYPGYSAGQGNAAALTGSGEDVNRQFATIYPRTPVYVSFLVTVSNVSTTGDYFLHLGPTVLSSNFRGRVFVRKSSAGGLQFGVSGSTAGTTAAPATYTTSDYAFNTTYLLLLKYSFDETGNETDLFINPATSGVKYRFLATPDLSVVEAASSSPTDIGTLVLRQGASSPALTVDAITVATAFPLATPAPLPVTLTDFTAKLTGQSVQLDWQTASEQNAARFEIERSMDATTFTRQGARPAAGNSSTAHAYAFMDTPLPAGVGLLYYRLRQVDLDGTSTYSPVRVVALPTASATLALFPNPTQQLTTLTGAAPHASVQVLDALGRTVSSATADPNGTASLRLPAGLAPGVYVVRTGSQALRLLID